MTRVAHIQPYTTGGRPPETCCVPHFQLLLKSKIGGHCSVFDQLQRSVFGVQCSVFSHIHHSDPEPNWYIYHSDHLGSSSFLTDAAGDPTQHLQYMPFGETFVEQRSITSYYTPYTFSAKERDLETGYSYFGARYYDADISIWLSVDPMSDASRSMSPYNYCYLNPIVVIDPDGNTGIRAKDYSELLTEIETGVSSSAENQNPNQYLNLSGDQQKNISNRLRKSFKNTAQSDAEDEYRAKYKISTPKEVFKGVSLDGITQKTGKSVFLDNFYVGLENNKEQDVPCTTTVWLRKKDNYIAYAMLTDIDKFPEGQTHGPWSVKGFYITYYRSDGSIAAMQKFSKEDFVKVQKHYNRLYGMIYRFYVSNNPKTKKHYAEEDARLKKEGK
jgi:RHS repeat-associated protein